jgi:hypothetical protein
VLPAIVKVSQPQGQESCTPDRADQALGLGAFAERNGRG